MAGGTAGRPPRMRPPERGPSSAQAPCRRAGVRAQRACAVPGPGGGACALQRAGRPRACAPAARGPGARWRRWGGRGGGGAAAGDAAVPGAYSPRPHAQRPPRARRGTSRYEDAAPARQRRARSDGHASRQAARHRKYSPARARGRPASAPLRPRPRTPPVQPAELPPPPPPLRTRWARGCPPVPARRAEELRPVSASGRAAPGVVAPLPGSTRPLGRHGPSVPSVLAACACRLGSSVHSSAPSHRAGRKGWLWGQAEVPLEGGGGLVSSLLKQPWLWDEGEPCCVPGVCRCSPLFAFAVVLYKIVALLKWKRIMILFAVPLYFVSSSTLLWTLWLCCCS